MAKNWQNEHCEIAAQMLGSEAGLLDYRLIEHLNNVAYLNGGVLDNRQVIAALITTWQIGKADDFTK